MPNRPIRYQDTGHLHFLTWSCADRLPYLLEVGAMETLESVLEQVRRNHGFQLLGYVFMPEHVHLLVSEPTHSKLSDAISVFKGLSSRKLKGSRTRFWLPRYHDFNVFTEHKRIEKLRYMHRNPVARGLVEKPENYRWSSYRRCAFEEEGVIEVTDYRDLPVQSFSDSPPIAPNAAR